MSPCCYKMWHIIKLQCYNEKNTEISLAQILMTGLSSSNHWQGNHVNWAGPNCRSSGHQSQGSESASSSIQLSRLPTLSLSEHYFHHTISLAWFQQQQVGALEVGWLIIHLFYSYVTLRWVSHSIISHYSGNYEQPQFLSRKNVMLFD